MTFTSAVSSLGAPESSEAPMRRWVLIGFILILVLFGAGTYSESLWLPPIDDSDEMAYLGEASWIAEHGGAALLIIRCYEGEYPYDNRHPLTAWWVSPWAAQSLRAVRPMRAAKVLLAVGALALTFALCRRMMSPVAALAVMALLAASQNWYMKSRVVCAEPTIYAFFFLAWALIAGLLVPRGRWFWAGAAVALAWLTKGTALILLAALPLAAILFVALQARHTGWQTVSLWRPVALLLAGFLVVASPLLVRNVVRFGNPFYNRNSALMWADDDGAQHMTPEQSRENPLTPMAYLKRHSAGDIVERMSFGLRKQVPRLLGSLAVAPDFGVLPRVLSLMLSAAIVLLGLWGAATRWKTWAGLFTLVLVALTLLLFAWHSPITYASRFAATLAPVLAAAAFALAPQAPAPWSERAARWALRAAGPVVVLALLLLALRVDYGSLRQWPRGEVPMTPEHRFLLDWIQEHAGRRGEVCFQTPFLAPRYPVAWLLTPSTPLRNVPPFKDFATLQRHMDAAGARYLIVERDSMRDRWDIFAPFFDVDYRGAVVIRSCPPGWRFREADPFPPADFVILERESP